MAAAEKMSLDPLDYEDIDIDDEDNPELTEEDFARARPIREFPELAALVGVEPSPARRVTLSVSQDAVDYYRAQGRGWRERMAAEVERAAGRR